MKCNLNTAGKRGVLSDGFFSGKINYMCEKLWQSEGKWAEGNTTGLRAQVPTKGSCGLQHE